eukprot:GGOE01001042.1.p1 GENE.GGOE01001042.1~~GGOE01001042.1.p1  ORF type:complete len:442 (-),score=41.05 GGOE01001042.1:100-1425(-)
MQGTQRAKTNGRSSEAHSCSPFQSIEHVMVARHTPTPWQTQELDMRANLELESISWHRDEQGSDSDGDSERPTFTLGHAVQLVKARSEAQNSPPRRSSGTLAPTPPLADPLPARRTSSVVGCASVATDLSGISSIPMQSLPPPSSPSLMERSVSPLRPPAEQKTSQQRNEGRPARVRPAVAAPPARPEWWGFATTADREPQPCAAVQSSDDEGGMIDPVHRQSPKVSPARRSPMRIVRKPLYPPDPPKSAPAALPPGVNHTVGVVSTYRNQAVFEVEEDADGGPASSDSDSPNAIPRVPLLEADPLTPPVGAVGRPASPAVSGSTAPMRVTMTASAARASPVPNQSDRSVKSAVESTGSAGAPRHEVTWVSAPKLDAARRAELDLFDDGDVWGSPGAIAPTWGTPGWGQLGLLGPPAQPANGYVWAALRQHGGSATDDDSD